MTDKAQEMEALRAACETSVMSFGMLFSPIFEPFPHLEPIAQALERVAKGECKRLIINMPPRHGKSFLVSTFFPAFYMAINPRNFMILSSYNQDLADDFGKDVRNIMRDPTYGALFPKSMLATDSVKKQSTHTGGKLFFTGVDGPVTGRGAHVFLIDDPIKSKREAYSEAYRKTIKSWYRSVAYTRLMKGGAIVLIQTRWHPDDPAGWVQEEFPDEDWEVISMGPYIKQDDGSIEALCPDLKTLEELRNIEKVLTAEEWASLYLQKPVIEGGNIIDTSKINYLDVMPDESSYALRVQSWDTAFKKNPRSDYSACTSLGVRGVHRYMYNLFKDKLKYPALKRMIIDMANSFEPDVVLIENAASGQSLIQDILDESSVPVIPMDDCDKISRAYRTSPMVEAGRMNVPKNAYWVPDFISNLAAFPAVKHDDDVDSFTQAVDYCRGIKGEGSTKIGTSKLLKTSGRKSSILSML